MNVKEEIEEIKLENDYLKQDNWRLKKARDEYSEICKRLKKKLKAIKFLLENNDNCSDVDILEIIEGNND